MKRYLILIAMIFTVIFACTMARAQGPQQPKQQSRVLVFFSLNVENDHALFATDALKFFMQLADRDGFRVEATTNWSDLNENNLKNYKMIVWLNGTAGGAQRTVFQKYMENGGAWMGFHVAAYNDKGTRWPWYSSFLGAGVFGVNNWPPLPAKLIVDDQDHPITKGLPKSFVSPTNEWYSWRPSPRLDKNIHVLLTIDPSNYPLGIKGLMTEKDGDVPVMWTNTNYKMVYMNMGHGDKVFTSPLQNQIIENATLWLLGKPTKLIRE